MGTHGPRLLTGALAEALYQGECVVIHTDIAVPWRDSFQRRLERQIKKLDDRVKITFIDAGEVREKSLRKFLLVNYGDEDVKREHPFNDKAEPTAYLRSHPEVFEDCFFRIFNAPKSWVSEVYKATESVLSASGLR